MEERLWRLHELRGDRQRGETKVTWLSKELGENESYLGFRSSLLRRGDDMDPLWNVVHDGFILMSTAMLLIRLCEKRGVALGDPPEDLLKKALATPLIRGMRYSAQVVDGKPVLARALRAAPGEGRKDKPKHKNKASFQVLEGGRGKQPERRQTKSPAPANEFKARIRELTEEFVRPKIGSITEEHEVAEMVPDFLLGVDMLCSDLFREVQRKRSSPITPLRAPPRNQVIFACETLGIVPPKVGAHIDMKMAKKRYQLLANRYHTDKPENGPATEEMMKAVLTSWDILQRHEDFLSKGTK